MHPLLTQFHHHVETLADRPCWRVKSPQGAWEAISWAEAGRRVRQVAAWLIARGLRSGEPVAIWAGTRVEWTIADLAIIMAGGVTVPVYATLPLNQATFIINEPRCRFLFVEALTADASPTQIQQACPQVEQIIQIGSAAGSFETGGTPWPALFTTDVPAHAVTEYDTRWRARGAHDVISYVYTSGTTGVPKGVELTLENFSAEVDGLQAAFRFPPRRECLMFLPLAHIVARAMQFFQLYDAHIAAYAEGIEQIGDNLRETRPHFFVGVPRIFEKVQARMEAGVRAASPLKQRLMAWAMRVGQELGRRHQRHERRSFRLWWASWAHRLLTRPIHARLGGRLQVAVSGGAPLAAETARFFHSLGILILEGYGLTETTAAITLNRADDYHFGTVGKPLPNLSLRLADDGEILVKGPTVFHGYYQRPQETAEVLEPDGWFHTGDIGAFSRDGFLRITDRKKDLIKTSGGKYVAPAPIENRLKAFPLISDVMVHGDQQKYITALVTVDRAAVEHLAAEQRLPSLAWEELVAHPEIVAAVQHCVDAVNAELASFETIKQFRLLPHEFAVGNGELTPTLKLRRKVAFERYRELFAAMYAEGERKSA